MELAPTSTTWFDLPPRSQTLPNHPDRGDTLTLNPLECKTLPLKNPPEAVDTSPSNPCRYSNLRGGKGGISHLNPPECNTLTLKTLLGRPILCYLTTTPSITYKPKSLPGGRGGTLPPRDRHHHRKRLRRVANRVVTSLIVQRASQHR